MLTTAKIEIPSANGRETRLLALQEVMRLGRDPDLEIVLDAAASVVSRQHAMIQCINERYILTDLGSFNGTLVNGQRITQPTTLYDGNHIQLGMGGPVL